MKVKDLERTANVAWSPANQETIYLAAGTAAQQLDASFNTNAVLEVYTLNLTDPTLDVELKISIPSEGRFHKLLWGPHGSANGTIVGGCDDGIIQIYNAAKVLKGENALVSKQNKHTGIVHGLDFNPFQQNLLASGAADSQIYIWDMNNTNAPMTPGAKPTPHEDVLSIAWNRQVQHILASTFSSKCVVWDLRKNEPIIKLTDTVSRIRWKVVEWHPEVATQLCLASEEDHSPVIQLWDLRFATSPLKTMEYHQRGILSMAWCIQDPDLLVSCAKDNKIVCWNPNSNNANGEVLSQVAETNQWSFEVVWCPKNPALIASPCFDGHVSIYSVMGGKTQQIQTTDKIADSFPGMDGYMQPPPIQQQQSVVSVDLSKPPKWLKKPVGASFAFGGKLITFENEKNVPGQSSVQRLVHVSQVVTEVELVDKSKELEQTLEYGNFDEYCLSKADLSDDQHKKYIWHFIKANFKENSRAEILNLLGYKIEDVHDKLNQYVGTGEGKNVESNEPNMTRIEDYDNDDPFSNLQNTNQVEPVEHYEIKTGDDTEGLIAQALLLGNIEAAVELCLNANRFADAIIISMRGGADLFNKTQSKYLKQSKGYVSSLIGALVTENWTSVVNNCHIDSWKEALSAILTHSTEEDLPKLCDQLGNRLEQESDSNKKYLQDAQLCYICSGNFEKLVTFWIVDAQKSSLALQELVELVVILQKAFERKGRRVEIYGKLAELLTNYAFILASQGNLQTAVHYLGNSQNAQVANLRERLFVALDRRSQYNQASSRKSSTRSSFSSFHPQNQFNPGLPSQTWQPQNAFALPQPFAPPVPQAPLPNPTGMMQPQPQPPNLIPPPSMATTTSAQPPRPPSTGSGAAQGLPSRSKYVIDPSVQSNQYGTRNNFAPNPLFSGSAPISPPVFQTNALQPNNMNNFQPFANNNMPPFNQQVNSPPPPSLLQPQSQTPSAEMGVSAINALQTNVAHGWNDPPSFNASNRPARFKPEVSKQDPITHPLFGAAPVQNNGYDQPPQFGNQFEHPQILQPMPPMSQTPSMGFGQAQFNNNPINQNVLNANNQQQQVQPEVPQVVQKPPIPEEHIHMQTVFDELKSKCAITANNPQLKRKIDDVSKKLEALYDLLRERRLSPNTLASLHQIVQCIQNGDYMGGLNVHTQLVSGPDFAQIACFMPGLKVLLQSGMQLQVYLR